MPSGIWLDDQSYNQTGGVLWAQQQLQNAGQTVQQGEDWAQQHISNLLTPPPAPAAPPPQPSGPSLTPSPSPSPAAPTPLPEQQPAATAGDFGAQWAQQQISNLLKTNPQSSPPQQSLSPTSPPGAAQDAQQDLIGSLATPEQQQSARSTLGLPTPQPTPAPPPVPADQADRAQASTTSTQSTTQPSTSGTGVEDQRQFENEAGLSTADAYTACGPVAAVAFARTYGRNPTPVEAINLAKQVGWNAQTGMAGASSEVQLLKQMGVDAHMTQGVDWTQVSQSASSSNPVILDTPGHYFFVDGYNADTGQYHVGASGTSLRGGAEWMTPDQITKVPAAGGAPRAAIFADNPVTGQKPAPTSPVTAPLSVSKDNQPPIVAADAAHPAAFATSFAPYAQYAAQKLGIDPTWVAAMAASESNYGKADAAGHELFGVKALPGQPGTTLMTHEGENGGTQMNQDFVAYDSPLDSVNAWVDLIKNHYPGAVNAKDLPTFVHGLKQGGYFTAGEGEYLGIVSGIQSRISDAVQQGIQTGGDLLSSAGQTVGNAASAVGTTASNVGTAAQNSTQDLINRGQNLISQGQALLNSTGQNVQTTAQNAVSQGQNLLNQGTQTVQQAPGTVLGQASPAVQSALQQGQDLLNRAPDLGRQLLYGPTGQPMSQDDAETRYQQAQQAAQEQTGARLQLPSGNPLDVIGNAPNQFAAGDYGQYLEDLRNKFIAENNPVRDQPFVGGATTLAAQTATDPTNLFFLPGMSTLGQAAIPAAGDVLGAGLSKGLGLYDVLHPPDVAHAAELPANLDPESITRSVNINLAKYPEEVRGTIAAMGEALPETMAAARRGVISDQQVSDLADQAGIDVGTLTQHWNPGDPANAETMLAMSRALAAQADNVVKAQQALLANPNDIRAQADMMAELIQHAALQEPVTGLTAEAGRTLRVLRQPVTGTAYALQQLQQMAGRSGLSTDDMSQILSRFDLNDPEQVAQLARMANPPKLPPNEFLPQGEMPGQMSLFDQNQPTQTTLPQGQGLMEQLSGDIDAKAAAFKQQMAEQQARYQEMMQPLYGNRQSELSVPVNRGEMQQAVVPGFEEGMAPGLENAPTQVRRLTPEAQTLLDGIDNGGSVPPMTRQLRDVAEANGVSVPLTSNTTAAKSPEQIIEELRSIQGQPYGSMVEAGTAGAAQQDAAARAARAQQVSQGFSQAEAGLADSGLQAAPGEAPTPGQVPVGQRGSGVWQSTLPRIDATGSPSFGDVFRLYHTGSVVSGVQTVGKVAMNSIVAPLWNLIGHGFYDLATWQPSRISGSVVAALSTMRDLPGEFMSGFLGAYRNPESVGTRFFGAGQPLQGALARAFETPMALHAGLQQISSDVVARMELGRLAGTQATRENLSGYNWFNRVQELMDNPRPGWLDTAQGVGKRAALQGQLGGFGTAMESLVNNPALGIVGRTIWPVFRIGMNFQTQRIEQSPIGLGGTLIDALRGIAAKQGPYAGASWSDIGPALRGLGSGASAEQRAAAATNPFVNPASGAVTPLRERFANNLLGTGIAVAAAMKAFDGTITGAGPEDPTERASLAAQGWQPYSVRMGDRYYNYQHLPGSYALAMVANYADAVNYPSKDEAQQIQAGRSPLGVVPGTGSRVDYAAERYVKSMFELMGSEAGLTQVSDMVDTLTQGGINPTTMGKAAGGLAGSFVPMSGALRSVANMTDPYQRQATSLNPLEAAGQTVAQDIPGLRQLTPARQSPLGEPLPNPQSGLGALAPMPTRQVAGNPILSALSNINESIGPPPDTIAYGPGTQILLNPDEQRVYQQAKGDLVQQILTPMIQSGQWQQMDPATQRSVWQRIEPATQDYARGMLLSQMDPSQTAARAQYAPNSYLAPVGSYGPDTLSADYLGQQSLLQRQTQHQAFLQALNQHSPLLASA